MGLSRIRSKIGTGSMSCLILLISALSLHTGVSAADNSFYLGAGAGYFSVFDQTTRSFYANPKNVIDIKFDDDFTYNAAIGFNFKPFRIGRLRAELEFMAGDFDTNDVAHNGTILSTAHSEISTVTGMANIYFDFNTSFISDRLTPYIGAGGGGISITQEVEYGTGVFDDPTRSWGTFFDDRDDVLCFQLMAGLNYRLSEHLDSYLQAVYLGTTEPDLTIGNETLLSEFSGMGASIGLRYHF